MVDPVIPEATPADNAGQSVEDNEDQQDVAVPTEQIFQVNLHLDGNKVPVEFGHGELVDDFKNRLVDVPELFHLTSFRVVFHKDDSDKQGTVMLDTDTFDKNEFTPQSYLTLTSVQYSLYTARDHIRRVYEFVFHIKKTTDLPISGLPAVFEKLQENRNRFVAKNPELVAKYEADVKAWMEKRVALAKAAQEKKEECDDEAKKDPFAKLGPPPQLVIPPTFTGPNRETASTTEGARVPSLKNWFRGSRSDNKKQSAALVDMSLSAWNPPTANRQLQGDLFYLEIRTHESTTLHVTACSSGFYVNNSDGVDFDPAPSQHGDANRSSTLIDLLNAVSPAFKTQYAEQKEETRGQNRRFFESAEDPLPHFDWIQKPEVSSRDPFRSHMHDLHRAERVMQMRDWNEDYQVVTRYMPENTPRMTIDINVFRQTTEYVNQSIAGVKEIMIGNIPALNPTDAWSERMYLYDNIFFVLPNQGLQFEGLDGEAVTRAQFSQDLRALQELSPFSSQLGLSTIMVANIDYAGHRFVCQPIVPGILHRKPEDGLLHGSLDIGKKIYWDEETHKKFDKIAAFFHIRETKLKDASGEVHSINAPVEVKAIRAADGRTYVMDLVRTTPRDANYPGAEGYHKVLRRELVRVYVYGIARAFRRREMIAANKAAKEAGEDVKEISEPEEGSIEAYFAKCLGEIPEHRLGLTEEEAGEGEDKKAASRNLDIRFNINLDLGFGEFEHADSEEEIATDRLLNKHLATLLTSIVTEIVSDESQARSCAFSSDALVTALHSRGINVRYLGRVASEARARGDRAYLVDICEEEMVLRAAKHILRNRFRDVKYAKLAATASAFLSALVLAVRSEYRTGSAATPAAQANNNNKKKKKGKKGKETSASADPAELAALWAEIVADVKASYDYELGNDFDGSKLNLIAALRHICLAQGITLSARNYNLDQPGAVHSQDIVNIHPVVDHVGLHDSQAEQDLANLEQISKRIDFNSEFGQTLASVYGPRTVQLTHRTYSPLHESSARSHELLAAMFARTGEHREAAIQEEMVVAIYERVFGADHPATIQAYSVLAQYCANAREWDLCLEYRKRVVYLQSLTARSTNPLHILHVIQLAELYLNLQNLPMAREYYTLALTLVRAADIDIASAYRLRFKVCQYYLAIGQSKEAIALAKEASNLAKEAIPDEKDPRRAEAETFLQDLVKNAVAKQRQNAIPQAAAPAAASVKVN